MKTLTYLSIKQYAERYHVHERTVERWIRDGQLKAVKQGWAIKIAEDEKPKGVK